MNRILPTAALLLLAPIPSACKGRFEADGPVAVPADHSRPSVPPPPAFDDGAASFGGIGSLTPLVDGFDLAWTPIEKNGAADPDYVYAIWYTVDGRTPDFTRAPDFQTGPGEAATTIAGLASGTLLRAGVHAINVVDPTVTPDSNEIVLSGEVLTLLYVDGSVPASGDGTAPDRAFKTIAEGILAGLTLGGANLLIAEGVYEEELLALGHLHFYGAWPAGFAGPRDRSAHPTTIAPALNAAVALRVSKSDFPTFVDALEMDGGKGVTNGVDVRDADLELSNCAIFRIRHEGVTYSSNFHFARFAAHRVDVSDCGSEGMQLAGVFDAHFTLSTFVRNGHEGVQIRPLTVFAAGQARLRVARCVFSDNVEDGFDVLVDEIDPIQPGGSAGGIVEGVVEESIADGNGQSGVKLDIDYDPSDGVFARFFVRATRSLRNTEYGFHLDGDAAALFVLAGNVISANRFSSILASSEVERALYQITNHWESSGHAAGVEVLGPADVLLDHVAICGTAGAAIAGNGATRLVDGALFLAPPATATTVEYSFVDSGGGGLGVFSGAIDLGNAPDLAFHLAAAGAVDRIPLPPGASLAAGDVVEFEDDGVARSVTAVTAGVATFDPPADSAPSAGAFVARFPSGSVVENPTLVAGSPWIDAGDPLVRDDDATVTDVGVLGGVLDAYRPVFSALMPFVVQHVDPPFGPFAGPVTQVSVEFTRDVDATSVDATTFAVTLDGAAVAGTFDVQGDVATLVPVAPITSGHVEVALASGIRDLNGSLLLEPLRYSVGLP